MVVDAAGADPHHFAGYDLVAESSAGSGKTAPSPTRPTARAANPTTRSSRSSPSARSTNRRSRKRSSRHANGSSLPNSKTVAGTGSAAPAQRSRHDRRRDRGPRRRRRRARNRRSANTRPRSPEASSTSPRPELRRRVSRICPGKANRTSPRPRGRCRRSGRPARTRKSGRRRSEAREPLDYMESMQQADGHIRWRANNDINGIWMTAYVTPAFAGQALLPYRPGRPRCPAGAAAACLASETQEALPIPAPEPRRHRHRRWWRPPRPAFSRPKAQSRAGRPAAAASCAARA